VVLSKAGSKQTLVVSFYIKAMETGRPKVKEGLDQ
jgi:hypothetical protein